MSINEQGDHLIVEHALVVLDLFLLKTEWFTSVKFHTHVTNLTIKLMVGIF